LKPRLIDMEKALRVVTALLGVGFTLQGIGWLVAPERAAAGLGMSLLDGLGRSTQIGDFAAFFVAVGICILAGVWREEPLLLRVAAGILACAAFGRTVAWAVHGADFAPTFIAAEIVASLLFLATARAGALRG
jgi:hypothetical protein